MKAVSGQEVHSQSQVSAPKKVASKIITETVEKPKDSKVTLSEEAKKKQLEVQNLKKQLEEKNKKIEDDKKEQSNKLSDMKRASILEKKSRGNIKKPGVFFLTGMDLFSNLVSESYDGIREMAESVKGARLYGWNQKDAIVEQISKIDYNQPLVLVGHSFGGDSVVEIAEELNQLEHNFRPVDLLVTIDSVGSKNDIIPTNVRKNINIFGDKSPTLNDGPNIAKNHDKTNVQNILKSIDHTDLDDDGEVQSEVIQALRKAISRDKSD